MADDKYPRHIIFNGQPMIMHGPSTFTFDKNPPNDTCKKCGDQLPKSLPEWLLDDLPGDVEITEDAAQLLERLTLAGIAIAERNGKIRDLEHQLKIADQGRDDALLKLRRQETFEQHIESNMDQLFIIWNDKYGSDPVRHSSFDEAKNQAATYAIVQKDRKYSVMMAVASCIGDDSGIHWVRSDVYFNDDDPTF